MKLIPIKYVKSNALFLLGFVLSINLSFSQRSVRIAYIDTEYILQNVPEFQEASSQLDTKVQKWKSEIESKLTGLNQKKKQLDSERILLTRELIEERQEEINIEEQDILEYQQKRFGPSGDLVIQRQQLMQPIQDQIFNAVQEIAETRKFDVIQDKSETTTLYLADRLDISDRILSLITRSSNRQQAQTRKERREAERQQEEEQKESTAALPSESQEARAKALEEKKAEREQLKQEKLNTREAKRKALEEKKKKILEDRAKANQAKINARKGDDKKPTETTEGETDKEEEEKAVKELTPREARKKALEEKKKKILEDRAKKAKIEKNKKTKTNTGESTSEKLSSREARKKALEEKKKKILEDRKKATQKKIEEQKAKDSTSTKNNNLK